MIVLDILRVLGLLLLVLILFNILIVVHELGHFLAARWRGLVVERFAIWFGKPIWKTTWNGVEYRLGSIPAGGYVALPQLASMEAVEGKNAAENLPPAKPLDKIIVAVAGPLFSFLLAIVFAVIVMAVGRPVAESEATQTIGYVLPDSPAAAAGLQAGDKIIAIDGNEILRWHGMVDSVIWGVVSSQGQTIRFDIERNGQPLVIEATPELAEREGVGRASLRQVGIAAKETPLIAQLTEDSLAEKAGLQVGDVILEGDGQALYTRGQANDMLIGDPETSVDFLVLRGEQQLTVTVPRQPLRVAKVTSDIGPAAEAGIQAGDELLTVNGVVATSTEMVLEQIEATGDSGLPVVIRRDGEQLTLEVAPRENKEGNVRIGLLWDQNTGVGWMVGGPVELVRLSPYEQIVTSVRGMANTLGALFTPGSSIKAEHLSGPVGIINSYLVMLMSENGWRYALWFSVFLNVNLAILNMLPIPVLDGGHIVLSLYEMIRRKPLNVRLVEFMQTACALLLMGYMLYVTFYDVVDIPRWFGWDMGPGAAGEFAPREE
ncbi:MAG: RIP metalloprotease RseP [Verrucomicrobiales bacterium]